MLFGLFQLLRPFRRGFVLYFLSTLLRQGLVVGGGYGLVLLVRFYGHDPQQGLLLAIAAFSSYQVILLGLDTTMGWKFASCVSYPMFLRLSVDTFARLMSLDQGWHQAGSSGVRLGEVKNGVSKLTQTSESLARELCPLVVTTLLSIAPLGFKTPALFWLLPPASIVFFWLSYRENRQCTEYRKERYKKYGSDYSMSIECIQMHADVVRYGQEERMKQVYGQIHNRIQSCGLAELKIQSLYGLAKNAVVLALQFYLFTSWIALYKGGKLDAAMLLYLFGLSEQMCGAMWGYAGIWGRIAEAIEPIRLFLKVTFARSSADETREVSPLPVPAQVGLEFRDVSFGYRSGKPVLSGFNLSIEAGSIVGLVGVTGCGKSTILRLSDKTFGVQAGSVTIGGQDIRHWPLKQIQRMCLHLSQNGGVFFSDDTLLDTIRFAQPDASFSEVVKVAKLACIHEEIMATQDGYQTKAGEGGKNLSGGQRQRIALAQALLSLSTADKKLVLLDECTSELDEDTESKVLKNIWPMLSGKTVVIVTHRPSAIADRVHELVVLDQGRVRSRTNRRQPQTASEMILQPTC